MSLAMSKAAALRPEIKLSQALKDYEAALTEDQKKVLRHASPPEPCDVMALTFEVNRQNEVRRSRVWGARLSTFLNSVKDFTAVVDTIITSIGNPIAGAVWGAVKMAVQAASAFDNYFDALSTMLMNVGRNAPRYEKYALLYPASVGVRKELCNYFSVVIEICKTTVLFIRKPFVSQAWDALRKPFRDEFGKFERELESIGNAVRDEVSLAAKKQQILDSIEGSSERREMSLFRRAGAKFQQETVYHLERSKKWREITGKSRFLDSCSTYNHESALNQARRKGRSTWLFEDASYHRWKSLDSSSAFLCSGIVGAGKTVLSSSVVEDLVITRAVDVSIGYFFCRDDDLESLKARAIVGSLTRQLLSGISAKSFGNIELEEIGSMDLNIEQIVSHLLGLLGPERQYIVVLDGLDECKPEEAKILFETLRDLLRSGTHIFKLFWTGRSDFVARIMKRFPPDFHVSFSRLKSGPEISNFIESTLDEALEEGRLQLRDPEIILKIQDALETGAREMFLWVAFQIDSICRENTDEGVLKALENLPKDMPTTYRRILRRLRDSGSTDPALGKKIFEIITAARRPLSLEELREAISVEPGNTSWNAAKQVNDVMKSLDSCGSLVVVDDEFSTVQLAHSSVRQHLESSPELLDVSEYHIDPDTANGVLGDIVVTYLNLDTFQRQVTRYNKTSTTSNAQEMSNLLRASIPLPIATSSGLARRFLKIRKTPQFDIGRELEKVAGFTRESKSQSESAHELHSYAQDHWISHTKLFGSPRHAHFLTYRLLLRLIDGRVPTVNLPWSPDDMHALSDSFVGSVSRSNHWALLQSTIQRIIRKDQDVSQVRRFLKRLPFRDFHSDEVGDMYEKVMLNALAQNDATLARLLLDNMDITVHDFDTRARLRLSALDYALHDGTLDILEILLDCVVLDSLDAESSGSIMRTAAISPLHDDVIPLLLARGVDRLPIDDTVDEIVRERLVKAYSRYDRKKEQEVGAAALRALE